MAKTKGVQTFPGGDATAEDIAVLWRAVLGLPKDFPITSPQVTVCMAGADAIITRTLPPTPVTEGK